MWLAFQRRWLKRVLLAASVLIVLAGLYAVAGFLVVPHLVRSQLTDYAASHYHRRIALGDIRFNPFTLTLDVRDLALPDADGAPMVGAGRLHVELSIASLWRRAMSFRDILIERPFARAIVRPDGALNLTALPTPANPSEQRPPAHTGAVRLVIDRLTVAAGRATYDDRTASRPFHTELAPINFELRDFSTLAAAADQYSLDIMSSLGERFRWSGTLGVNPAQSRGRFEVAALRAATLASLAGQALPLGVSSGLIALQGTYELTVGAPTDLHVGVSRLTVSQLGVRPRKASSDSIDLAKIEVDASTFDLGRRALTIGPVRLDGGTIRVWRTPAGTLNLSDLMGPPPAGAAPAAARAGASGAAAMASAAPPAWSLSAPDISVAHLEVQADDQTVTPAATARLSDLALHVGGFRSPAGAPLDLSASTAVNGSGRISARGTYVLSSGAAKMHVQLEGIDLTALQPYLAQRSSVRLTSGLLDTRLDVARSAEGALTVSGSIGLAKLRTIDDRLRRDFIKWDRLTLSGLAYRSTPGRLAIREISVRGPYARLIVASDRTLNIAEAFTPGNAAAPAARTPNSPRPQSERAPRAAFPIPVSIGKIKITNGSAHYTDLWIEPHFTLAIQSLEGFISGMSSDPSSRARIELDGKVDEYAPLHVSGELNLLSATVYTDMKMTFKGVELTTATPYSAHFAGYKIEKGKISADIDYHIENGNLRANHHIVIDQLQLGEQVASKDAVKLPLKLAVALLKDRNGVIDLGLPVTGSLSDPKFKLGPLIWKVAANLIVKAAAAPFALLGRLFGGGEQMKYIDFDPGSADLDAPDRKRLAAIGKALSERPGLELDVPSAYAPSLDRPALGRAMLNEKLLELSSRQAAPAKHRRGAGAAGVAVTEEALSDPTQHLRLLLAEYRAELGKQTPLPPEAAPAAAAGKVKQGEAPPDLEPAIGALEAALLERMKVSDDKLDALGRRRARAIRDALLGGGKIAPGRLYVLNTAPTGAEGPRVRLQLGLK